MATLWGKKWTRNKLLRHCGRLEQVAGCTRVELTQGQTRGVELCEFRTGNGFEFTVCPSRGMDIVSARHNGRSLCWESKTGATHPAFYEAQNGGWLRGFFGGLVTTCGLGSFGAPCEDEGEFWGLHDRVSYLPAANVHTQTVWTGDECEFILRGTLRQTRVFGMDLRLERQISARLGENRLFLRDQITNDGFAPAPLCLLYHCNFGFPVVSEGSMVRAPSKNAVARDEIAQKGADSWDKMEFPQADYAEQCFFHEMQGDASGKVRAEIWNPALNFGGYVAYSAAHLPFFTQWKQMGAGDYVCGLEPSNAPLKSRTALRESGQLPHLEAGETREWELELGVVEAQ